MRNVLDKTTGYFRIFSCVLFAIVAVATLINIIGRTFFNSPLKGSVEVVQYGTMLAAAVVMSRTGFEHRHIVVDVILRQFPPGVQRVLNAFAAILGTVVFGGVAYLYYLSIVKYLAGGRMTDALRIPYWILYAILCAGFALGAIIFLYQSVVAVGDAFKKHGPEAPGEAEAEKTPADTGGEG